MSSELRDTNITKYYILTKPTKLSELSLDAFEDDDYGWRERARRLQARRWRKIKHQIA